MSKLQRLAPNVLLTQICEGCERGDQNCTDFTRGPCAASLFVDANAAIVTIVDAEAANDAHQWKLLINNGLMEDAVKAGTWRWSIVHSAVKSSVLPSLPNDNHDRTVIVSIIAFPYSWTRNLVKLC